MNLDTTLSTISTHGSILSGDSHDPDTTAVAETSRRREAAWQPVSALPPTKSDFFRDSELICQQTSFALLGTDPNFKGPYPKTLNIDNEDDRGLSCQQKNIEAPILDTLLPIRLPSRDQSVARPELRSSGGYEFCKPSEVGSYTASKSMLLPLPSFKFKALTWQSQYRQQPPRPAHAPATK